MVSGNHDITLDPDFYARHGLDFHNQEPQDALRCQELLENGSSILWLKHESAVINLESPTGPRTTFKVFGSPYSPAKGKWAFGYGSNEAAGIWDLIPPETDIVLTHTSPKFHCDEARDRGSAGCPALREALWRVRPRMAICGHVHEGRGVERVIWVTEGSDTSQREENIKRWEDPGRVSNKLSLVDLTLKGGDPIQNDGSFSGRDKSKTNIMNRPGPEAAQGNPGRQGSSIGFGPTGRVGRQETCIVNAAIMASSWPHGPGGKKFNKPIVVDIDLPVWDLPANQI